MSQPMQALWAAACSLQQSVAKSLPPPLCQPSGAPWRPSGAQAAPPACWSSRTTLETGWPLGWQPVRPLQQASPQPASLWLMMQLWMEEPSLAAEAWLALCWSTRWQAPWQRQARPWHMWLQLQLLWQPLWPLWAPPSAPAACQARLPLPGSAAQEAQSWSWAWASMESLAAASCRLC